MSKQQVQLKEKELSIEDLKNTDHVGFEVDIYGKGYVLPNQDYKFFLTAIDNKDSDKRTPVSTFSGEEFYKIKDAIKYLSKNWNVVILYRFDTRKELYQWLAEG